MFKAAIGPKIAKNKKDKQYCITKKSEMLKI